MEREATIKEEQNVGILDLYQKIADFKSKLSFLTSAVIRILSEQEFPDDAVNGYQLIMYSLEDEIKEIDSMLDTLLDKQRHFDCSEARIKAGIRKDINKDLIYIKEYIEHINKLKVRAEDVLERGQRLS